MDVVNGAPLLPIEAGESGDGPAIREEYRVGPLHIPGGLTYYFSRC